MRAPWTARRPNQSILNKFTLNIHWKDDPEAETPIIWPPDAKSQLTRKDSDAGRLRAGGEEDDIG